MTKCLAKALTAWGLICLVAVAWGGPNAGQRKNVRFASERSPYPFFGASRVMVEDFDPTDKGATAAMLQLDKNEVLYSSFGEPRVTAVFYKPFQVKLTRLNIADPAGKGRHMFSVELPKEVAADLGKNSLRLVTVPTKDSELVGIRLLLVNPDNKVTQILELRPPTN